MPELANEIPSHDELEAYWQEHWVRSALSSFEMSPEELMRWYIPEVAEAFLLLIRMDGREFARFAYQAILTGLERLNQLPRSHPFWRNTNRRPTIYKLGEFCRMELAITPGDPELLHAAALLSVWHGSNDFGQEHWLELCRQPAFDVRWPLYAALTTDLTAAPTAELVAVFLRAQGPAPASISLLHRIAAEGEGMAVPWAAQILGLLEEPRPGLTS